MLQLKNVTIIALSLLFFFLLTYDSCEYVKCSSLLPDEILDIVLFKKDVRLSLSQLNNGRCRLGLVENCACQTRREAYDLNERTGKSFITHILDMPVICFQLLSVSKSHSLSNLSLHPISIAVLRI